MPPPSIYAADPDSGSSSSRIPARVLFVLFITGMAVILGWRSSSILKALLLYPLISVAPCLFFLALIGKRPVDLSVILPLSIMTGPVFSMLTGAVVLCIRPGMDRVVPAIMLVGAILGLACAILKPDWAMPRPGKGWLPAAILSGLAVVLVVIPCAHSLDMRLTYDGWFHNAVANWITRSGIPPEDPLFPGEHVHNYWFYHLWGAILSWAFQRPPADMFSFMNVHALIGVILGVWMCAVEFFKNSRARLLALFFAIFGLNTLGVIYFILNYYLGTVGAHMGNSPHRLIQFMTFHGDHRIPYFLDKFFPSNGFPLGVCFYAACAWLAVRVIRRGANAALIISLMLSSLGMFLIHPTSAIGAGVGIGAGLAFLAWEKKSIKSIPLWIIPAMGVAAAISLPYLLAIFPFNSEGAEEKSLISANLWNTVSSYPLMVPFLALGIRYFYRSKDPASVFVIGLFAGTALAAIFLKLPGANQYKFIQLMCIPAGLLSAASFIGQNSSKFKKTLLAVFISFTVLNTAIIAYAYAKSPLWREPVFVSEGIHINPSDKFQGDLALDRWLRTATPENAILLGVPIPTGWVLYELSSCGERSQIYPFDIWVSIGHEGEEKRRQMAMRIFSDRPFSPHDLEDLSKFERPVYFVLPLAILNSGDTLLNSPRIKIGVPRIPAKFAARPELFELVYDAYGFQVYRLKK